MSDELRAAFDLQARAEAMAAADPPDRISLRDHVVTAEIGAFEAERGVAQRLRFDIVVEVRPVEAAADDVDRVLSYDRLAEAAAAELGSQRHNLLETLAERVAARILREPQAGRVFLRVQKLDRGPGELGVEIVRAKRPGAPDGPAADAPRPRIAVVAPDALPALAALIDRAQAAAEPLLACALPALPPPPAATDPARRRIALLALDQAAWALASREPRLLVAGSRTELDWALRRGRHAAWAPARIVLDAPDAPEGRAGTDPLALAAWLAGGLAARGLTLLGVTPPPGFRSPVPLEAGAAAP